MLIISSANSIYSSMEKQRLQRANDDVKRKENDLPAGKNCLPHTNNAGTSSSEGALRCPAARAGPRRSAVGVSPGSPT